MKNKKPTRFLSLVLTVLMIISIVPINVFSSAASAQVGPYRTIDNLKVPCVEQHNRTDCALCSITAVEASVCGVSVQEAYKSVIRNNLGTSSHKPNSAAVQSWGQLGYETTSFSLEKIYEQLLTGYPCIVHRAATKTASEHWSVVYGYNGNSKKLEAKGFLMMNVNHSGGNYTNLEKWSSNTTVNRIAYRKDGLEIKNGDVNFAINHPALEHIKGKTHSVLGRVISKYKITNIKVYVENTKTNKIAFSKSSSPNSKSFCLSEIDKYMTFKSLPCGTYNYVVEVKLENGKSCQKSYSFSVVTNRTGSIIGAPKISITNNNSVNKPTVISWSKVDGATGYKVYVNGKEVGKTTSTSYSYTPKEAKKYEIKVLAYNSYLTSQSSNVLSFTAHNPCKVTFVNWDDTPLTAEPVTVDYGKNAIVPEIPVREGYTFTGWDNPLTNITSDRTIKAQFRINTYTVKFFDSNGNVIKSEKVKYNEAATAPTEVNAPTGYSFLGWSTDEFETVKSDLNVYGIYDWGNRQLPISVSNVSAIRQQDGYYVYFDLTNYPDAITRGRAVVSLKTAEGKLIDTTESAAFSIPKSGTKKQMEVFVPSDEVATTAELIIVNSYSSGVPISEMKSSEISFAENMWSNWSDTAPAEGTYSEIEERTLYRSRDKEFSTASTPTKDGWTLYDTTSAWGPYGAWSSWSKNVATKSNSRDVETRTVTDAAAYTQYTLFYFRYKMNGSWWYTYSATQSKKYNGEKKVLKVNSANYAKTGKVYGDFVQYKAKSGYTYYSGELWFHETTCAADTQKIPAKTHTEYKYRDRSLIYTYHFYRWTDWTDWTDTGVAASDNKQVETKKQYRYVSNGAVVENNSGVERTISGNVGSEYAGKQLSLFVYKVDEASDFTNEFVGQQAVGADGSYSFTFKLREEPSAKTGDFTVAIGLEGSNNIMIIDTIKAPKPTFEVKFFVDGKQIGETQTVEQGSAAVLPENPTKEGYTFCGWSADTTNVQSNLEVEANMMINKYTVVFVDWVAETVSIKEFEHGSVLTYSDAAEIEGYTFAGWEELDGIDAVVTHNMVLTAKYDKDVFTVVFYDFDGNVIKQQNVEYGEAAELPTDPAEDNMVFCGWESNEDLFVVTSDVEAYANFVYEDTCDTPYANIHTNEYNEPQTVTLSCDTANAVIYYTTDGSNPSERTEAGNTVKKYTDPIEISKNTVLKFYAECDGMNSSEVASETYVISNGSSDSNLMLFEDLPEYVIANPAKYNVHTETGYKYKDITSVNVLEESYDLENDGWTKYGESFSDWSDWSNVEPNGNGMMIETETKEPDPVDTPFYQYKHWKYYDADNQAYVCSMSEVEGYEGEWETLELPSSLAVSSFVDGKPAYNYNDELWFSQTIVIKGVVPDYLLYRYRVKSLEYYKWTDWTEKAPTADETRENISDTVYRYTVPASHLVTVHTNSEIGDVYYIVFENETVSVDAELFEMEGFRFVGLCSDAELTSDWDVENDVVMSKLDLYPKYAVVTNTVTFMDIDGSVLLEQEVNYGEAAVAPEYVCEDGYTFLGWDKDFDCITEDTTVTAISKPTAELITVSLNIHNKTIYADSMYKLIAKVSPESATKESISWSSSNNDVATVDDSGVVTAVSAGTAIITVTTSDGIKDSCTITVKGNDIPESITISSKEVYVTRYSTKQLTCSVTPTGANTDVTWTSTNPLIASIDENGVVTGNMAGSTIIIATSADGSRSDYCYVKVIGMNMLSTASVNYESGIISGLSANMASLDGYIEVTDDGCDLQYDTLGTDSIVYLTRDDEVIDAYTVVIFGDVNGDGWYDGQDAVTVSMIAGGMLTREQVGEAVWMAADCNHDGVIDQADVELLNQAGVLLSNVDQTKSTDELLETSAEYVEYLNLIDQQTDADSDETPEDNTEENQDSSELSLWNIIVKYFVELIKKFLSVIKTF